MACVKDTTLPPSVKQIAQAIENDFLSIDEIVSKTGLPKFKVKSGIRTLQEHNVLFVKNDTYKLNKPKDD